MIVHYDDSSGSLGDRRAEHLTGMHQRTVEESSGNEDIAEHTALTDERQQMEWGPGSFVNSHSPENRARGKAKLTGDPGRCHPPQDGHVPSLVWHTIADSYTLLSRDI